MRWLQTLFILVLAGILYSAAVDLAAFLVDYP